MNRGIFEFFERNVELEQQRDRKIVWKRKAVTNWEEKYFSIRKPLLRLKLKTKFIRNTSRHDKFTIHIESRVIKEALVNRETV